MAHPTLSDVTNRITPMAEKKKNWIKQAVPKARRGVFKAKAEAAGKTTAAFAKAHDSDKGKLGKEARLAGTLMGMGKKKSAKLYDHPRSQRD